GRARPRFRRLVVLTTLDRSRLARGARVQVRPPRLLLAAKLPSLPALPLPLPAGEALPALLVGLLAVAPGAPEGPQRAPGPVGHGELPVRVLAAIPADEAGRVAEARLRLHHAQVGQLPQGPLQGAQGTTQEGRQLGLRP